ncbi:MAG: chemotaxis protein CheW [Thermoanaerobaculia bacterium]|nr:chemotaxis protein CheW [Thermoanaerobaculia bacterium]
MDQQIFEALVDEFYLESRERIQRLEQALVEMASASPESWAPLLIETRRELHTIKGNAGMMGLKGLQALAHRMEDRLDEVKDSGSIPALLGELDHLKRRVEVDCGRVAIEDDVQGETISGVGSVRVAFAALDALVEVLSEMVIFRNRLSLALDRGLAALDRKERSSPQWREVEEAHDILEKTLEVVQDSVMRLRMVPMESLLSQQRRVVFDEAEHEAKLVEFRTEGGETPLDKALLEVASDALGHLVRNAVVHGIESPDEREAAGKSRAGHLEVRAHALSDEVVLDIEDDGRGIDGEILRRRAIAQGHEIGDSTDLVALLALPGVSTRESADESAGRGMGMAAVVESIRRGGGQLEVDSLVGRGTSFRIRLPLSAAIISAIILGVDGEVYAMPAGAVREVVDLREGERHVMNGTGVLRWRGELVPLVDLGVAFSTCREVRETGQVVFVESEGRHRGLVVDRIVGLRDIVVKALGGVVGKPYGVTGCTVLGDGNVVLILDPGELTAVTQRVDFATTGKQQ